MAVINGTTLENFMLWSLNMEFPEGGGDFLMHQSFETPASPPSGIGGGFTFFASEGK